MADTKKRYSSAKFASPEDLEKKTEAYFIWCEKESKEKGVVYMPTKGGYALHLDTCRDTLSEYMKMKGFSDVLKKAYDIIEEAWVQKLSGARGSNTGGTVFYLKNAFAYRDVKDVKQDITSGGKTLRALLTAIDDGQEG